MGHSAWGKMLDQKFFSHERFPVSFPVHFPPFALCSMLLAI
jgi:hypothetical protein